MSHNVRTIMYELLRFAIDSSISLVLDRPMEAEDLAELYAVSDKHDLVHLIGHALFRGGWIEKTSPWYLPFQQAQLRAVYRYEQSRHELRKICDMLEAAGIDHMPLKGAVVRDYYPEAWLRTSCDLDVLVHPGNLDRAIQVLKSEGWTQKTKKGYHDVSLYSEGGVHLELHFNIQESLETLDRVLQRVWAYSTPVDGTCEYRQSNTFLLFHLLAHMSYHFTNGGCGLRPFLDIWILRRKLTWNEALLRELCAEAHILKFYEAVLELIAVWFEGGTHTELTRSMEEFVTAGGVYGSTENRVMVNQVQTGGRMRNLCNRIWMPFAQLKTMYPVLKRHNWLCPVYEVVRWVQIVLSGRGKKALRELRLNHTASEQQVQQTDDLLDVLGLKERK